MCLLNLADVNRILKKSIVNSGIFRILADIFLNHDLAKNEGFTYTIVFLLEAVVRMISVEDFVDMQALMPVIHSVIIAHTENSYSKFQPGARMMTNPQENNV